MTDSVKTLSDMLLRDDSVSGDLLATLVAIAGSAQALAKIIASGPLGAVLTKRLARTATAMRKSYLTCLPMNSLPTRSRQCQFDGTLLKNDRKSTS